MHKMLTSFKGSNARKRCHALFQGYSRLLNVFL